jgi:hypothetical protein
MSDSLSVAAPTREQLIQELQAINPTYSNYLDTLSPEKRQRIQASVAGMRTGLHTVAPTMCMGPKKCLFVEHCPIPPKDEFGAPVFNAKGDQVYGSEKEYPIARPCVMETFYMQQKIVDYVMHLGVNPANPVEMSIVNELALIDLYKNRALIVLSKGDKSGQGQDFLRVDITGFSDSGATTQTTTLHPVADYLDKLEKRRERWLDKLVETRKSKVDAAHKLGSTDNDSIVLRELKELRAALNLITDNAVDSNDILEVPLDD